MIRTAKGEYTLPVEAPERDAVSALVEGSDSPTIVSISDIHGYLDAARSALRTLGDHEAFDALVSVDDDGALHWDGNDSYVLVFNGDLVDRGPNNEGVLDLVDRLRREAPPGHVKVTLGNHEMGVLTQDLFHWRRWYSGRVDDEARRALCADIMDGHVVAAFDGYNVTYAHAGRTEPYDPGELNASLASAANTLQDAIGTPEDVDVQQSIIDSHPAVLGLGGGGGRGPSAGIAWLDFTHMPADAPPQVVGHTRQDQPVQKGNVVCENVIRNTQDAPGGEAVVVETPERLCALERTADGGVTVRDFDVEPES